MDLRPMSSADQLVGPDQELTDEDPELQDAPKGFDGN